MEDMVAGEGCALFWTLWLLERGTCVLSSCNNAVKFSSRWSMTSIFLSLGRRTSVRRRVREWSSRDEHGVDLLLRGEQYPGSLLPALTDRADALDPSPPTLKTGEFFVTADLFHTISMSRAASNAGGQAHAHLPCSASLTLLLGS